MSNPTGINQYSKTGGVGNKRTAARRSSSTAKAIKAWQQAGSKLKSGSAGMQSISAGVARMKNKYRTVK